MPAILKSLEKARPIYDTTYKVILFLCKLLLIGDIAITTWSVIGRYIPFIDNPNWSEEIVLTLMVYMAVLSATLAIRRRAHIRMTSFDQYLPETVVKVSDLIADIAVCILGVVLVIYGAELCGSPLAKLGHYSAITSLSKFWQYLSIPVAGAGMIIFELEQIVLRIKSFYIDEEEEAK